VEKPTRNLWNTLFCILQFAAKNHRSWKNPPGTYGTNCFETRIFEAKSTSRGRLHQALTPFRPVYTNNAPIQMYDPRLDNA